MILTVFPKPHFKASAQMTFHLDFGCSFSLFSSLCDPLAVPCPGVIKQSLSLCLSFPFKPRDFSRTLASLCRKQVNGPSLSVPPLLYMTTISRSWSSNTKIQVQGFEGGRQSCCCTSMVDGARGARPLTGTFVLCRLLCGPWLGCLYSQFPSCAWPTELIYYCFLPSWLDVVSFI